MSGNGLPIDPKTAGLAAFKEHVQQLRADPAAIKQALLDLMAIDPSSYLTLNAKMIQYVYEQIIQEIDKGNLNDLQEGTGKYFKRSADSVTTHGAPDRNFAIYCDRDAYGNVKYRIFLDPKSKLEDNTPLTVGWPVGAYKICKGGFDITDLIFAPLAALVYKDKKPAKDLNAIVSQNIMHGVDPVHFDMLHPVVDDKGQLHIFTKHANFDLHEVMSSGMLQHDYPNGFPELDRTMVDVKMGDQVIKVERCRLDVIYQIMAGIAALEQKFSHRDIKPENINCYYDPVAKRLIVKLADFDFAQEIASSKVADDGTKHYLPPESAIYFYKVFRDKGFEHEDAMSALKKKISDKQGSGSEPDEIDHLYGFEIAARMLENIGELKTDDWSAALDKLLVHDEYAGKHDVWSAGIVFTQILAGNFPDVDNPEHQSLIANTLLEQMLSVDVSERLSATEILKQMRESEVFASVKDLDPLPSILTKSAAFVKPPEIQSLEANISLIASSELSQVQSALTDIVKFIQTLSIYKDQSRQTMSALKTLIGLLNAKDDSTRAKVIRDNLESLTTFLELGIPQLLTGEEGKVDRSGVSLWRQSQEERLVIELALGACKILDAKMHNSSVEETVQALKETCEDLALKIHIVKTEETRESREYGRFGVKL